MYPLLMIGLTLVGILLLVAAGRWKKKSVVLAGILGIAGTFLIVAGIGAIYLLRIGEITLPLQIQ